MSKRARNEKRVSRLATVVALSTIASIASVAGIPGGASPAAAAPPDACTGRVVPNSAGGISAIGDGIGANPCTGFGRSDVYVTRSDGSTPFRWMGAYQSRSTALEAFFGVPEVWQVGTCVQDSGSHPDVVSGGLTLAISTLSTVRPAEVNGLLTARYLLEQTIGQGYTGSEPFTIGGVTHTINDWWAGMWLYGHWVARDPSGAGSMIGWDDSLSNTSDANVDDAAQHLRSYAATIAGPWQMAASLDLDAGSATLTLTSSDGTPIPGMKLIINGTTASSVPASTPNLIVEGWATNTTGIHVTTAVTDANGQMVLPVSTTDGGAASLTAFSFGPQIESQMAVFQAAGQYITSLQIAGPLYATAEADAAAPTAEVHLRKQVSVDDGGTWHNAQTGAGYTVADGTDDQQFDNAAAVAGDDYPVVMEGGVATYRYQVWLDEASTGWVNWADVATMISDDNGTPADPADDFNPVYVSGDSDGDGMLELGEQWLFDDGGHTRLLAAGDDVTNIATLTPGDVINPGTGTPTGDQSTLRTDPARVAAVGASVVTQISAQTAMIGDTISDTVVVTGENAGIPALNPDVTLRLYNLTDDPTCAGTPIASMTLTDVAPGTLPALLAHLVAASEAGDKLGYIEQVEIPELDWTGAWSQCGLVEESLTVTAPKITTGTNAERHPGDSNFDDGTVTGVPATFTGTIRLDVYRYVPGSAASPAVACTAERKVQSISYPITGPGVHRSPNYQIPANEVKGVQYIHVETLIAADGTVLAAEACGNTSEITTIARPVKKGHLIKTA